MTSVKTICTTFLIDCRKFNTKVVQKDKITITFAQLFLKILHIVVQTSVSRLVLHNFRPNCCAFIRNSPSNCTTFTYHKQKRTCATQVRFLYHLKSSQNLPDHVCTMGKQSLPAVHHLHKHSRKRYSGSRLFHPSLALV